MQVKRGRGRPSTGGRRRDKKITLQVTEQERDSIKKYAKSVDITVTDLLLKAVEKKI
ncbi:hypothetical protein HO543_01440 [Streptococcus suis]|nr:hypothetical protein [Streptococcus suis]NQJ76037.1 hypothetical protein [Streptococcus suis]